jgi:hypothetical protein
LWKTIEFVLRGLDPRIRVFVSTASTDTVRAGRQSQDRRGTRPHRAAVEPPPSDQVIE